MIIFRRGEDSRDNATDGWKKIRKKILQKFLIQIGK
jgi:hypothetical protein